MLAKEMLPPPPPHPPLPGLLEAKRNSDSALQQLHLQLGQHLTNNSNPNIPSNLESLNRNPRHLQMFMERELDYMAAFGGEQKRRRGRNTSKQQHQTAAHNEIRLSDDPRMPFIIKGHFFRKN
jgi:hypothetical protein